MRTWHACAFNTRASRGQELVRWSLGGVVIEAQCALYFPGPVFELPQGNEAAFTRWRVGLGMHKAVSADLDGAKAFHVVGFERTRDEFSNHVAAADIFLDAV